MAETVNGMTDDEYAALKTRLFEDALHEIRKKTLEVLMVILEWSFKALGALWPIVLAWLRKNGYLDL